MSYPTPLRHHTYQLCARTPNEMMVLLLLRKTAPSPLVNKTWSMIIQTGRQQVSDCWWGWIRSERKAAFTVVVRWADPGYPAIHSVASRSLSPSTSYPRHTCGTYRVTTRSVEQPIVSIAHVAFSMAGPEGVKLLRA